MVCGGMSFYSHARPGTRGCSRVTLRKTPVKFSEQNKFSMRPCSAVPRAESSFCPESMVSEHDHVSYSSEPRLSQPYFSKENAGDYRSLVPSTTEGPRALRRGRMMAMAGGVKGDM